MKRKTKKGGKFNERKIKKLRIKIEKIIEKEINGIEIEKKKPLLIQNIKQMILEKVNEEKMDDELVKTIEYIIDNEIDMKKEQSKNESLNKENLCSLINEEKELLQKINKEKKLNETEAQEMLKIKKLITEKIKQINIELYNKPKEKGNNRWVMKKEELLQKKKNLLEEIKSLDNNQTIIKAERKKLLKILEKRRAELLKKKQKIKNKNQSQYNKRKKELSKNILELINIMIKEKEMNAKNQNTVIKVDESQLSIQENDILNKKIQLSDEEKSILSKVIEALEMENDKENNQISSLNELQNKIEQRKLEILEKEKILKDEKRQILQMNENLQFLEDIFNNNKLIPLNILNSRLNQLISRQNQLKSFNKDLVTKKLLQNDQLHRYECELQKKSLFLKKLKNIAEPKKSKVKKKKNKNIIQEKKSISPKENNSKENRNEILQQLEKDQISLTSEKKEIYRKLKLQLKNKYELKKKRNELKVKQKQLINEQRQIEESLIEASYPKRKKLLEQLYYLNCLQKIIEEDIEHLIHEKKRQRIERIDSLMEQKKHFMKQKQLIEKMKETLDIKNNNIKPEYYKHIFYSKRLYSLHALERMKERNISFKMVEKAIKKGDRELSDDCYCYINSKDNTVIVVSRENGKVVTTMMKKKQKRKSINITQYPMIYKKLKNSLK